MAERQRADLKKETGWLTVAGQERPLGRFSLTSVPRRTGRCLLNKRKKSRFERLLLEFISLSLISPTRCAEIFDSLEIPRQRNIKVPLA